MKSRCPECGAGLPAGTPAWVAKLTVADRMTTDVVTLGPEESLMHALQLMRRQRIRRIPIMVAGTLVGLIVEGDVKRAQPSALSDSQEEFNKVMEETPVSRIMINKPVTVDAEAPLLDAARLLYNTKFGALPVMRDGNLVGMITDHDMVGCLTDLLTHAG